MKADELRAFSDAELRRMLDENHQELFNLRLQLTMRKTKNHQRIPHVKRDIARIMTILHERELMRKYGGEEALEAIPADAATSAEAAPRRGLMSRIRRGKSRNTGR